MNNKSHVAIEHKICQVCGETHETGNILLDTKLRNTLESKTVTGFYPCPKHLKEAKNDFVALIELEEGVYSNNINIKNTFEHRTGKAISIRKEDFKAFFNTELEDDIYPMVFIEFGLVDKIREILERSGARQLTDYFMEGEE